MGPIHIFIYLFLPVSNEKRTDDEVELLSCPAPAPPAHGWQEGEHHTGHWVGGPVPGSRSWLHRCLGETHGPPQASVSVFKRNPASAFQSAVWSFWGFFLMPVGVVIRECEHFSAFSVFSVPVRIPQAGWSLEAFPVTEVLEVIEK